MTSLASVQKTFILVTFSCILYCKCKVMYGCESSMTQSAGASVLHGFVERPKQRRHRCKDPTKLDVNSLTGEERVPVVHRGTGRRVSSTLD